MNKAELELLLTKGEGYKLEFKENVNSDLSKEMVAFANSAGGVILVGINDNNEVIGVTNTNDLISKIQDHAQNCDPSISVFIDKFEDILVVNVPEGANKPYRNSKGFFLRNGANSQKMTTSDITEFLQSEGRVRFDEIIRDDQDFEMIFDTSALDTYLKQTSITKSLNNLFCCKI